MDKVLKEKLKNIKRENGRLNPDRVWVGDNRARIISRVKSDRSDRQSAIPTGITAIFNVFKGFVPQRIKAAAQPVMVMFLVTALSIVGWGATVSAEYSLPGDALYGVKRAKEKTQEVVSKIIGGSEAEAKALINQKKNRAVETAALIQKNSLDRVGETLDDLADTADRVHQIVQDTGETDPQKAAKIAADSVDATEDVDDILKEAQKRTTDSDVAKKISQTQQQVTDIAIDAVGMIVDGQESSGLSNEEVGALVKKTIDNLVDDTEDVSDATDEWIKIGGNTDMQIEVPSTTIKFSSGTLQFAEQQVTFATSSNGAGVIDSNIGTEQIGVDEVRAAGDAIKDGLTEAKQLAEAGQLTEALQKAKDVNSGVNNLDIGISKVVIDQQNQTDSAATQTNTMPQFSASTTQTTVVQPGL